MLKTELCGVSMKSPIIAASGTFGFGTEYKEYVDFHKVGAISVKGLTLEGRKGNQGRRIAETPSGILNCIGLENPGVHSFLTDILPEIQTYGVPIMANISGNTFEEYGEMAKLLDTNGIDFIEVNISCPNVKNGCLAFGVDARSAAAVTEIVKRHTTKPVIMKLSPNVTDITEIARAVEGAGADGISLINTLLGMSINTDTFKPELGNIMGGLSGPAVKPIAVRMVYQVCKAVTIPVVGMGGIMTGRDAVEFMLAGATAVSVGTATLVSPDAIERIADEMVQYGHEKQINNFCDLVGKSLIY